MTATMTRCCARRAPTCISSRPTRSSFSSRALCGVDGIVDGLLAVLVLGILATILDAVSALAGWWRSSPQGTWARRLLTEGAVAVGVQLGVLPDDSRFRGSTSAQVMASPHCSVPRQGCCRGRRPNHGRVRCLDLSRLADRHPIRHDVVGSCACAGDRRLLVAVAAAARDRHGGDARCDSST